MFRKCTHNNFTNIYCGRLELKLHILTSVWMFIKQQYLILTSPFQVYNVDDDNNNQEHRSDY